MTKVCIKCGKTFETISNQAKYCSNKCKTAFNRQSEKFTKSPNVQCTNCSKHFFSRVVSNAGHTFCCRKCKSDYERGRSRGGNVEQCTQCGKEIRRKKSHIGNKVFCSNECYQNYRHEHGEGVSTTVCTTCNTLLIRNNYRLKTAKNMFCSKECFDTYQRRFRLNTTCANCGEEIWVSKYRQDKGTLGKYFCSVKCANTYKFTGQGNPNWKGVADITKTLRNYYEKVQRPEVFRRSGKKCVECGKPGYHGHHKYPLYRIIEDYISTTCDIDITTAEGRQEMISRLLNDKCNIFHNLDNIVCLCKPCHMKYHGSGWMSETDKSAISSQATTQVEGSETSRKT